VSLEEGFENREWRMWVVMRGRAVLAVALVLAGVMDTVPAALAQEAPIEVVAQTLESHFPDDLTFTLSVRSEAADIVDADLYLQVGWQETTRQVAVEPFTPGPEVELTAVWNTFAETIPPFIEITAYWEVRDSSGTVLTTEPVLNEYSDTTHDWQRLEDDRVVVFWYDRPAAFGEALFQASQEAYDHVAEITGASTERAVRVVIYRDQEDFCAFFAPRTCQDWIGGLTLSGITVQWGSRPVWFTDQAIPHELAHVFYGEIFSDTWIRVPTWFNEGIAVYNERRDHSQDVALVRDAAEEGKLKSLSIMTRGGGVAEQEVDVWYAVAYSLVAYLAETYGEDTLGELILTLADNVRFEDALVQTTGLDMGQLEMAWRAWLGYPVDSIPTPVAFPTMPGVTIVPPTVSRGEQSLTPTLPETPTAASTDATQASDVPTATPPASSIPTATAPGGETPIGRPCVGSLAIALGSAMAAYWSTHRKR
jgi:hypothetical protein